MLHYQINQVPRLFELFIFGTFIKGPLRGLAHSCLTLSRRVAINWLSILLLLFDLLLKFFLLSFLFLPVQGLLNLIHHVLIYVSLKLHVLIFTQQTPCGEKLYVIFRTDPALVKDLVNHVHSTIGSVFWFLIMMRVEVGEEGSNP